MKKIIITIDGHSACGKSTLARQLADKLNYGYIDTGAMYRAVTYYFLENRVNVQKTREVDAALNKIDIHFKSTVGGNRTFLNGVDVEDTIRKMFVSKSVSHVAAMSKVRRKVVKQQQEMGKQKGIVMEGRDIGTVVFPKAELKFFLTASEEVRTQRRFNELKAKGQQVSAKTIQKNLKERDHIDSTRKDSPLKQAEEAIRIDNTNLTQKEQLAMTLALANERIAALNKPAKKTVKKTTTQKATKPSNSKKASTNKSTSKRPNSKPEKKQPAKSSNNKPTNRNKNQSQNKSTLKPANKKAENKKPTPKQQKPTQQKQNTKKRPNKTSANKPQKSKPKTTNKKSNTTSTKKSSTKSNTKKRPVSNNRRKPTPKPKQKTKKKVDLELDDFSF